jgi:8-oxo-dGTP pyrophosphatase MutT (NUDIX family)
MNEAWLLLEELRSYLPADEAEQADVARICDLLASASKPLHRGHYLPGHITASAYVYDPASGQLLLHHHRRLDRWLQMGGHVEEGESPRQAALREAREESGLEGLALAVDRIFDVNVHAIPAGKGEPDHSHFDVRFLVSPGSETKVRLDPEESLDLRWLDLEEAERRMNEPAAARVIGKIRALNP